MRGSSPKCSDRGSNPDDLDLQLLHHAQAFLECLQRQESPTAEYKEAWVRFYSICDSLLRRYAVSCHVLADDLDDCVQSAWREITTALPKFRDRGQIGRFCAWLRLIVHSKATDLCRYRARHPASLLTPQKEARLRSRELDPASAQERRDWLRRTHHLLAELRQCVSATNYRAFQLRFIEGCSVMEVAAALNLSVEQVCYRCYRVKEKFRQLFESEARKDQS